jgi:tripartite-type tricarboxylate transporter receptor subunit TctC
MTLTMADEAAHEAAAIASMSRLPAFSSGGLLKPLSHRVACAFLWALPLLGVHAAAAQNYPSKPVRIVAIGPGGSHDFAARLVAQALTPLLGQQVIVDNRPSGFIDAEYVSKAPPDGYTLLESGGALWVTPLLQDNVPYDSIRDFTPISLTTRSPLVLVVHPTLPVKSVKELITLAKAHPGQLNYSSAGGGSSSHLGGALFAYLAGIDIVRVPFKSGSTRMASLVSGEVQMEISTPGSVSGHIKTGRVKALAVTTAKPSALFPDLPPIATSLPGYEYDSVGALLAPPKMPPEIIARLSQNTARALRDPAIRQRFTDSGVEAVGTSPEELANTMKSEIVRLGKVIKAAHIRAQE